MFRMSHLGPHTYATGAPHRTGRFWTRIRREERHRLIEEDRTARNRVLGILASVMLFGLSLLVFTLVAFS